MCSQACDAGWDELKSSCASVITDDDRREGNGCDNKYFNQICRCKPATPDTTPVASCNGKTYDLTKIRPDDQAAPPAKWQGYFEQEAVNSASQPGKQDFICRDQDLPNVEGTRNHRHGRHGYPSSAPAPTLAPNTRPQHSHHHWRMSLHGPVVCGPVCGVAVGCQVCLCACMRMCGRILMHGPAPLCSLHATMGLPCAGTNIADPEGNPGSGTRAECAAKCYTNAKCIAFAWRRDGSGCHLKLDFDAHSAKWGEVAHRTFYDFCYATGAKTYVNHK